MGNWGSRKNPVGADDVVLILGRAMIDAPFRNSLLADPRGTLKQLGYAPTPDMVKFFKQLRAQGLGEQFEKVQRAYEDLGGPEPRDGIPPAQNA